MDVNGCCRQPNGFLLAEAGWLEAEVAIQYLTSNVSRSSV